MYNPFSLDGKTILVVGASSGIGQSIAVECSKMGATLIVSARSQAGLDETLSLMEGEGHQSIAADVTSDDDIKRILEGIPEINGLVMSAGKSKMAPIPFCTREKYDDLFNVNFFSQIELIRLIYKKKKIARGGSIVIISSIGGNLRRSVGNSIYGASKAAINTFMQFSAVEFAGRKIRVNTINPGMVNTKLIQGGPLSDDDHVKAAAAYPLKRYGEPIEIAHGAIYLLSNASSWMTGQSLVIDGGATAK